MLKEKNTILTDELRDLKETLVFKDKELDNLVHRYEHLEQSNYSLKDQI